MDKVGKVVGIFGVLSAAAFTVVCAFWAFVLPSLWVGVIFLLVTVQTILLVGLLPEFGLIRRRARYVEPPFPEVV